MAGKSSVAAGSEVVHAARRRHQVHHDFIGHSHNRISRDILVGDVVDGLVFEDLESRSHPRHVCRIRVDEQVDVLGRARPAVGDDGKATNQHVSDLVGVQRAGEADEVVELWLACVRAIMRVIHASASSKLRNRYTPRGTSAPVPRTPASMRCRPAGSVASVRRRPTVFCTVPILAGFSTRRDGRVSDRRRCHHVLNGQIGHQETRRSPATTNPARPSIAAAMHLSSSGSLLAPSNPRSPATR